MAKLGRSKVERNQNPKTKKQKNNLSAQKYRDKIDLKNKKTDDYIKLLDEKNKMLKYIIQEELSIISLLISTAVDKVGLSSNKAIITQASEGPSNIDQVTNNGNRTTITEQDLDDMASNDQNEYQEQSDYLNHFNNEDYRLDISLAHDNKQIGATTSSNEATIYDVNIGISFSREHEHYHQRVFFDSENTYQRCFKNVATEYCDCFTKIRKEFLKNLENSQNKDQSNIEIPYKYLDANILFFL